MKRLLISLSLLIVLLVCLWIGLGVFIRSDAFCGWLGHRVSRSLRAEGSFEPLSWSGTTFRSAGFRAVGQPRSKLSSLRLTGLTAHLDWPKLLTGQIILDSVRVDRADVELKPAKAAGPSAPGPQRSTPHLDFRIHFGVQTVTINEVFLTYQSRRGATGGLDGMAVTALKTGPDTWELIGKGGTIHSDRFPPAQVMNAQATLGSQHLHLHPVELASPDGGTASVQGEIQLNHELTSNLRAKLAGISLVKLLQGQEKVAGMVDADLTFQGDLNHFERGTIQGDFRAHQVRYDLARYLGGLRLLARSGFAGSVDFDSVAGHALYSNRHFLFSGLTASYQDAVSVTGTVEVTGVQLQGLLQVGVRPELVDWVPGSLEAVFIEPRDGLRWTSVRLSGTVQDPKEDLSKRILNAVQDKLGRDLKNQLKDTAKSLRDLFKH